MDNMEFLAISELNYRVGYLEGILIGLQYGEPDDLQERIASAIDGYEKRHDVDYVKREKDVTVKLNINPDIRNTMLRTESPPITKITPGESKIELVRDRSELARLLGVTPQTIATWETMPDFPGRWVGSSGFFPLEKIRKWVHETNRTPGVCTGPTDEVIGHA